MTRSALRIAFVVASLVALSVALAVACLALLLTPQAATAQETRQEQRQNTPGQFDFYVLSLPWSPSFCASAAERSRSGAAINAGRGPIRSSCTGNMKGAFRSSASFRRRDWNAASFLRCSI